MSYQISLEYFCGCVDIWDLILPPPDDDISHRSPEVCVAEHCQTCQAAGRPCPAREALFRFKPAQFEEITPLRATKRRKLTA